MPLWGLGVISEKNGQKNVDWASLVPHAPVPGSSLVANRAVDAQQLGSVSGRDGGADRDVGVGIRLSRAERGHALAAFKVRYSSP